MALTTWQKLNQDQEKKKNLIASNFSPSWDSSEARREKKGRDSEKSTSRKSI